MAERRWRVRLGAAAEVDFANILKWTAENFAADSLAPIGMLLFRRLANLLTVLMLRTKWPRDEILAGLRTIHIARHGRRGSHFLMYRAATKSTDLPPTFIQS